ncbi:hypothetical protein GCM10025768_23270 [Microbacterium pseudoresistens]|nr:helix-turn-helix transcriptional regulator [Microbacterium pseudoresistens]
MHTARLRSPADIGTVLYEARVARGMSQVELAAQTDLPQSTISAVENGMSTIHLRRLLELARATGLTITASWEDDESADGEESADNAESAGATNQRGGDDATRG